MTFLVKGQSINVLTMLNGAGAVYLQWHWLFSCCCCPVNNWCSTSAGPFRAAPSRRDCAVWREPPYPNGRESWVVSCWTQCIKTVFKSLPQLFFFTLLLSFLFSSSHLYLGLFSLCVHIMLHLRCSHLVPDFLSWVFSEKALLSKEVVELWKPFRRNPVGLDGFYHSLS